MDDTTERMQILEMIENGKISAAEGLRLLEALKEEPQVAEMPAENAVESIPASEVDEPRAVFTGETTFETGPGESTTQTPAPAAATSATPTQPEILSYSIPPDALKWKRYWMIPLWIGVGIATIGAMWMSWVLQGSGSGFWLFCSGIWLALGVLVIVLAVQSRYARWLHLRVQQQPGERPQHIAFSFPIPIGLASWFFRTFRHRIPGMDNVPENIDDLLAAVRDGASPDNPIYIQVDEDDGEKVEIYIG